VLLAAAVNHNGLLIARLHGLQIGKTCLFTRLPEAIMQMLKRQNIKIKAQSAAVFF
jgi:hypothetical protein